MALSPHVLAPLPSVWIHAHAGSGKTHALSERVLALLVRGVDPGAIVCLTYTKAAAAEMRARILRQVTALHRLTGEDRRARLAALLGHEPTPADDAMAATLFDRFTLGTDGGVVLETIHSYGHLLLRQFAAEAGLPQDFTVLEGPALARLTARALDRLSATPADEALGAALNTLAQGLRPQALQELLAQIVADQRHWRALWQAHSDASLSAALTAWHGVDDVRTAASDFRRALVALLPFQPELAAHSNQAERRLGEFLAQAAAAPEADVVTLCEGFEAFALKQDGTLRAALIGKRWGAGHALPPALEALIAAYTAYKTGLSARAARDDTLALAIVARGYLAAIEAEKLAAQALDFDDVIYHTHRLLTDPALFGLVLSQLDRRIEHLLLDEAQDTSPQQWQIVQALAGDLIAASPDAARSVLVVGDRKQSIYSFQGAAPARFAQEYAILSDQLQGADKRLHKEALTHSRRSGTAIIALVNALMQQPEFARAAGEHEQPHATIHTSRAGRVVLYPPTPRAEPQLRAPLTVIREHAQRESTAEHLARDIARRVRQWLAQPRILASTGAPITAGDIVILVRKRKPLVVPLLRALQREGIAVAGLDRLHLREHLAVRDLMALMRWIIDPDDDLALAHALRSPIFDRSAEQLEALAIGRSGSLFAALAADSPDAARLRHYRARLDASPYAWLTEVLEHDGARARFTRRFGEEVHEVLDELKLLAAEAAEEGLSLARFHQSLVESQAEIKRELDAGEASQVRILTVHAAKGMEAPVVILADHATPPEDHAAQMLWLGGMPAFTLSREAIVAPRLAAAKAARETEGYEEYLRLLYVALTRPREELHLCFSDSYRDHPARPLWHDCLAQAFAQLAHHEESGTRTIPPDAPPLAAGEAPAPAASPVALPDWLQSPLSALLPAREILTVSQLCDALDPPASRPMTSAPLIAPRDDARVAGTVLHRLYQLMRAECDAAQLRALLARLAPGWSEAEMAAEVALAARLIAAEPWIWDAAGYREISLCAPINLDGVRVAVLGQIDRLIPRAQDWVLIDYKTGAPPAPGVVPPAIALQMKAYQALVQQVFAPASPIRLAVLWTQEARLHWVDEAARDAQWPNQFVIEHASLQA